jgi:hypothetical protein
MRNHLDKVIINRDNYLNSRLFKNMTVKMYEGM